MAADGWDTSDSVERQLYADGPNFDFYQAVRLLEWLFADQDLLGETAQPARESVRFRAAVGFDFPPSDIAAIQFGPRLFGLGPEHDGHATGQPRIAELDSGVASSQWQEDFARHRLLFTGDAAATQVLVPGRLWKLYDRNYQRAYFVVRRGAARLDVYDGQATMLVNFMGLAGVHGPLPLTVTQLILERSREGDEVLRDFLDIFNHRLAALMYRVRKIHRRGMANVAPGAPGDGFGQYLYALIGLGAPGLQGRLAIPDRALLRYAGLLANQPRSAAGLEVMLSDYFAVPVEVVQFCGRWLPLADDERPRLGQGLRLGYGLALGCCAYDPQAGVELRVGPLDWPAFRDFLPDGHSLPALLALAEFYLRKEYAITVRLTLREGQAPAWRLGAEEARLGWTSWAGAGECM